MNKKIFCIFVNFVICEKFFFNDFFQISIAKSQTSQFIEFLWLDKNG